MSQPFDIPARLVRRELASIDSRLKQIEQEVRRVREEASRLQIQRATLVKLQGRAAGETPSPPAAKRVRSARAPENGPIPDGRVATPIIYSMIRERPGVTSVQIMDTLEGRVTKDRKESPRKFLADLIWELTHRKRLRRETDGGLFLVEPQGGEA